VKESTITFNKQDDRNSSAERDLGTYVQQFFSQPEEFKTQTIKQNAAGLKI